jgi:hypothetical protein
MCPGLLLPVGVLLSSSLSGYAFLSDYKQQQTISMRSHIREWTYVLLRNTPFSHLHVYSATGVSSGLAARMTLPRVSRRSLGGSVIRRWISFWFYFCTVVRHFYWVVFKWYTLHEWMNVCMHARMYACVYVRTYLCTCVCVCVRMHVMFLLREFLRICVWMFGKPESITIWNVINHVRMVEWARIATVVCKFTRVILHDFFASC